MPRQRRLDHPETWHHVMNRGADRQDVFFNDSDYLQFEWLLGDASRVHGVEVHAYCLMSNHFHLLVNCPDGGLSAAMQSVQFRYAQWFNRRYERDGPVFRGRFTSVLVTSDEQLLQVGRYIHRNPLAFVPRDALPAYRWSSLGALVGVRRPPPWLARDQLLGLFGGDIGQFRRHVESDQPGDCLGSTGFGIRASLSCDEIDAAVATAAGVDPASIRVGGRGSRNVPRIVAVALCVELRVATPAELTARYGFTDPSGVRVTARRGRVLGTCDTVVAELRRHAMDVMTAAA